MKEAFSFIPYCASSAVGGLTGTGSPPCLAFSCIRLDISKSKPMDFRMFSMVGSWPGAAASAGFGSGGAE